MWPDCSEQGAKQNDMRLGVEGKRQAITQEPFNHEKDCGLHPMIVGRSLLKSEQECDD